MKIFISSILMIVSMNSFAVDFEKYISVESKEERNKIMNSFSKNEYREINLEDIYYNGNKKPEKLHIYGSFSDGNSKFYGFYIEEYKRNKNKVEVSRVVDAKVSSIIEGRKQENDLQSGEVEYYDNGVLYKITRNDTDTSCYPVKGEEINPIPLKVRSGENGKIGKFDCGIYITEKTWEVSNHGDFIINTNYITNGIESKSSFKFMYDKNNKLEKVEFMSYSNGQYFKFFGDKNVLFWVV